MYLSTNGTLMRPLICTAELRATEQMDVQLTDGSTQYCSEFLVENAIADRTAEDEGKLLKLEDWALPVLAT